jgi:hypothetical protein
MKIYLTIILLTLSTLSLSQKLEKGSEEFAEVYHDKFDLGTVGNYRYFVFHYYDEMHSLLTSRNTPKLVKININSGEVETKPFIIKCNNKKVNKIESFMLIGKLIAVKFYNGSIKSNDIKFYNLNSLMESTEELKKISTDNPASFNYTFLTSSDNTKKAIVSFSNSYIQFEVFDDNGKSLWSSEYEMMEDSNMHNKYRLRNRKIFLLDSAGNIYLKYHFDFLNKKNINEKVYSNTKFYVFKFTKNSKHVKKHIELPSNYYTSEISIHLNTSNNIMLICQYFKKEDVKNQITESGIHTVILNDKLQSEFITSANYNENFIDPLFKRFYKKKPLGSRPYTYEIKDLIETDDSNFLIITEETCQHWYTPEGGKTITFNYARNIILTLINESGEILWYKTIEKKQISDDKAQTKLISFVYFINDNKIYFLYNDHKKNIESEVSKVSKFSILDYKKNSIYLDVVDLKKSKHQHVKVSDYAENKQLVTNDIALKINNTYLVVLLKGARAFTYSKFIP